MNDELRSALRRAAGEEPQVDLTESVWAQGRITRRRRHTAQAVGGVAAAAVLVGAFALGGGVLNQPEAYDGPAQPTIEEDAAATSEAMTYALPTPTPTSADPTEDEEPTVTATETAATQDPEATEQAPGAVESATETVPTAAPETAVEPTQDPPVAEPTTAQTTPTAEPSESESAEPTQPSEAADVCSASGTGGVVDPGEASPQASALAQQLVDLAAACDQAGLVAIARQHGTLFSFGGQAPEEAFALPERADEPRFLLLVETLTAYPGVQVDAGDEIYYEWNRTGDPMGWRVSIRSDGVWGAFLAGD